MPRTRGWARGRSDGDRIEGDAPGSPQLHHLRPCGEGWCAPRSGVAAAAVSRPRVLCVPQWKGGNSCHKSGQVAILLPTFPKSVKVGGPSPARLAEQGSDRALLADSTTSSSGDSSDDWAGGGGRFSQPVVVSEVAQSLVKWWLSNTRRVAEEEGGGGVGGRGVEGGAAGVEAVVAVAKRWL